MVVNHVLACGTGCFIAKADIKDAFRIVPIHPSSYYLLGFKWKQSYFYDMCLPMGCSVSCRIFEQFSSALQWIMTTKLETEHMTHILDDFIFIAQSQSACNTSLSKFINLAQELNIPIKESKTCLPATTSVVHGIEVDTIKMEARLPQDKLDKAIGLLTQFYHKRKTTLRDLQSLIGLLNFTCKVIVPGRTFLRRLYDLTLGIKYPHHHIRITREIRQDILIWLTFLKNHNGTTLLYKNQWLSSKKLKMYTDSAASLGYAGICNQQWFYGEWPASWKKLNIAFLELYPIVLSLELWCTNFKNKAIIFYSDNKAVVDIINNKSTKDKLIMFLVRRLVLICLQHNILFESRHLPGKNNVIADLLSRLQVQKARQIAPWLNQQPALVPKSLQPQDLPPKCSWLQHFQRTLSKHMDVASERFTHI